MSLKPRPAANNRSRQSPRPQTQPMQQPLTQEQILRLVERLDIPDCGCPAFRDCDCRRRAKEYRDSLRVLRRDKIQAMISDDFAALDEINYNIDQAMRMVDKFERCDCVLLAPPCEHLIEHTKTWPKGFTYDDYVTLVQSLDLGACKRSQEWVMEHSFNDPPPPPPAVVLAIQHETRIALYAKRHDMGLGLYGAGDITKAETLAEDVGIRGDIGLKGADRLANGQDRKGLGLGTGRKP